MLRVGFMSKRPGESGRDQSTLFGYLSTLDTNTNIISILKLILVKYFSRLRDESCKVRRNTLLVLSHLVTNEMVKVKGQISEVALCIVDEDEEIVGE